MALALIGIGLLMIGLVAVLSLVWSRPGRTGTEPGASGLPDQGGQIAGLQPSEGAWAKAERPRRVAVERSAVLLVVGLFATIPVTAFTNRFTCYAPGAVWTEECTEFELTGAAVPFYGMPGFAAAGLLGTLLVGYNARPLWLKICLVGQSLAALAGILVALLPPL